MTIDTNALESHMLDHIPSCVSTLLADAIRAIAVEGLNHHENTHGLVPRPEFAVVNRALHRIAANIAADLCHDTAKGLQPAPTEEPTT